MKLVDSKESTKYQTTTRHKVCQTVKIDVVFYLTILIFRLANIGFNYLSYAKTQTVVDAVFRGNFHELKHKLGNGFRGYKSSQVLPVSRHRDTNCVFKYIGATPPSFWCRQVDGVQPIKYSATVIILRHD